MYPVNSFQFNNKIWQIEKYQRLMDIRNCPLAVERKNNSDLVVQVNMNLKMLSVNNNEVKLEEFCFSPLVYPHEIICKDVRVLFTTKSQKDGNTNAKFRIRFRTAENCQSFCSFLSNFLNVTMYEDLQKNDFQNNSFVPETTLLPRNNMSQQSISLGSRPSSQPSMLNRSFTSDGFNLNRSFGELNRSMIDMNKPIGGFVNQSFSEADYLYPVAGIDPNLNRSFSENILNVSVPESTKSWAVDKKDVTRVNKVGIDMYTQTTTEQQTSTENNISVQASYNESAIPTQGYHMPQLPPIQPTVNITIGSLISDEAMKGFSGMIQTFLDRIFTTMLATSTKSGIKEMGLFSALKKMRKEKKIVKKREKKSLVDKSSLKSEAKKAKLLSTYTKKDIKKVKKNKPAGKTIFIKPQPSMPKNRTPKIAYCLRGATPPVKVNTSEIESEAVLENLEKENQATYKPLIDELPIDELPNDELNSQECWY